MFLVPHCIRISSLSNAIRNTSHILLPAGLNPRPMAHKTIALTTELREPLRMLHQFKMKLRSRREPMYS
eukprot:4555801-Karenia_brevis.AAC.1